MQARLVLLVAVYQADLISSEDCWQTYSLIPVLITTINFWVTITHHTVIQSPYRYRGHRMAAERLKQQPLTSRSLRGFLETEADRDKKNHGS